MDTSLSKHSEDAGLTSSEYAPPAGDGAATGERQRVCGVACKSCINWRKGSLETRKAWKVTCTLLLLGIAGWYFTLVSDSAVLLMIGAIWVAKLLIEIWGQHTPTWAAPGTVSLFIVVYIFGLPSFVYIYGGCRSGPQIGIPYREVAGVVLYLFGSSYSLWYEVNRFRWKARPINKGRLHTIGLAQYSIHPNYFGDLFTYTGWGLATGTQCALSMAPMSLFCKTWPPQCVTLCDAQTGSLLCLTVSRQATTLFSLSVRCRFDAVCNSQL